MLDAKIIDVIVALLVAAIVAYFLMHKGSDSATNPNGSYVPVNINGTDYRVGARTGFGLTQH